MKYSVITICLNSEKTIKRTIQSVNKQNYKNIEHIFVDGGSSDSTLRIISEFSSRDTKIVSQSKKGLYNAMNIGIKESLGDIIVFLNSDDFFSTDNILSLVANQFQSNIDIVYGHISYIDNKKNKLTWRTFKPTKYYNRAYQQGWHTPHPAFFIKKNSIKENFDESLDVSADFNFMFKHQEIFNLNSQQIDIVCSIMSNDGMSQSIQNIIKGNRNIIKSIKKYYKNTNSLLFFVKRFLFKLKSTL